MYFKYFDLPQIPEHLYLKTVSEFESLTNIFRLPNYPCFKQYHVNEGLNEFMRQHVKFDFFCGYQLIRNNIAIHKDAGRAECVNYLIDTGGPNAQLNIFDEDKITILHSEKIPPFKWHWIDVSKNHNVTGIDTVRIAISLSVLSGSLK